MANDVFKSREKGEEAKFKMAEELRFKAESRRNRLLGLWAGKKMGLDEAARKAYAKGVVASDFDEPGIEDVVRKIMGDFKKNDIDVSEADVRAEIARLYPVALAEIAEEYPDALK
ncbi:MAG: DUF1476 domain-containing protein [Rhodospirillales bacterium]